MYYMEEYHCTKEEAIQAIEDFEKASKTWQEIVSREELWETYMN